MMDGIPKMLAPIIVFSISAARLHRPIVRTNPRAGSPKVWIRYAHSFAAAADGSFIFAISLCRSAAPPMRFQVRIAFVAVMVHSVGMKTIVILKKQLD